MASEWWWFLLVNAIIAAVAVLSKVRPPLESASPRGGAGGFTRRASSAVLHRLRSSIFSFPSSGFHTAPLPHPEAVDATVSRETEEPAAAASPTKPTAPTPRAVVLTPPTPAPPAKEEDDDPNAMSMEEAYALVQAARRRPESERAEEATRSDVDAKAEEFIQGFKEDLRQQRLNSIFNYTQMLKKRAFGGGGGRQPDARPDQL